MRRNPQSKNFLLVQELVPYRAVFCVAFFAAVFLLITIPIQIAVFSLVPMPHDIAGWFQLFRDHPVVAMFHSDLVLLVSNVLISTIYLALYHLLKETNKGLLQVGILLGLVGIAAYVSSNKTFELFSLSHEYDRAASDADRLILQAAGTSLLAGWQGTAFDTYYVLNGITLLIVAVLMYRSSYFSKITASFGLASGILMCLPSTAGVVGLVFSLLSLVPWYVFTILMGRTFWKLGFLAR